MRRCVRERSQRLERVSATKTKTLKPNDNKNSVIMVLARDVGQTNRAGECSEADRQAETGEVEGGSKRMAGIKTQTTTRRKLIATASTQIQKEMCACNTERD